MVHFVERLWRIDNTQIYSATLTDHAINNVTNRFNSNTAAKSSLNPNWLSDVAISQSTGLPVGIKTGPCRGLPAVIQSSFDSTDVSFSKSSSSSHQNLQSWPFCASQRCPVRRSRRPTVQAKWCLYYDWPDVTSFMSCRCLSVSQPTAPLIALCQVAGAVAACEYRRALPSSERGAFWVTRRFHTDAGPLSVHCPRSCVRHLRCFRSVNLNFSVNNFAWLDSKSSADWRQRTLHVFQLTACDLRSFEQ